MSLNYFILIEKKTDNFVYISYFSTIKTTSYASNKKSR